MADYLLDTNAYFAVLRYIISQEQNEEYEKVINGNCSISKLTQIEIISVIGKLELQRQIHLKGKK